ncbi:hydrophobin 3 precursor [Hypoxylon fuscum]|nr:hydrophobin 3 precursor [Hypoxylon fuscum]
MQFKAITTLFTLAAVATAVPTEIQARTGGDGGNSCNNSQQAQVCCNGLLNCLVQVIGSQCTGQAYCCSTTEPTGTLINISALNCVQL